MTDDKTGIADLKELPPDTIHLVWYSEQAALLIATGKWALLGALAGLCVGFGTKFFLWCLAWSAAQVGLLRAGWFRSYDLLVLALPACVWLIRTFAPTAKGHGTEAVITAVHTRSGKIDLAVAPVKLLATLLTLAFGGSVGKEGPCAQIGASIASGFADILKLSDSDRRRLVICGIGAGFAAVFGTPVSGALFGIEVLYLGRIEYPVLFPCLVAGIVAHLVCGVSAPVPVIQGEVLTIPGYKIALASIFFGILCGLAARLLIACMKLVHNQAQRFSAHPYLVAASGGLFLSVFYHVFGSNYAGLGVPTIESALGGATKIVLLAFALKIVATSVSLETGGSGGIVTPLFFIGSTLGAVFASHLGLPTAAFAAFGFVAVVAAAANTPIAASVMGIELLPPSISVYAALCACTAYLIVGHRSVYPSQRLGFSKAAGLEMPLDVPIGQVTRADMQIRPGTLAERFHTWSTTRPPVRPIFKRRRRRESPTSDDHIT